MKKFFIYLLSIIALTVSLTVTTWYVYSQQFVQDSKNTATKGIFFKKTLNLKEYSRVSNGNDLLGKFDRYSRSDRHNDVITIYCKEYCSK